MILLRMMLTLALLLPGPVVAAAQAGKPDADAIIERHIAARGGAERIRAIKNLMFENGQYSEPDYTGSGDSTMMLMRPYHKLVGYPGRTKDFMEGYDGEAWEWFADPGIVIRTTGAASAAIRHFADVEGPFLNYRGKGSTAQYVGLVKIGDRPAYQVRLTMMDGYTTDNFFDQQSHMLIASRQTAKVHAFGNEVTSQTRFGDFRPVAGVLFPFRSSEVEIATGKELNAMHWGSITANRGIPLAWFSPPAFKRTPMQTFIEQLYGQREDPHAVMWTYRVFRRANPGVDTSDAAQVAGFQSLKMNATATAIALLEQNARDYPKKPNAAFGLGRAYLSAKRREEARAEFERALKLDPKHERARAALADLNHGAERPQ